MIVVSDSTPLIVLSRLNLINLLHEYFEEIYIPREVYEEVVIRGKGLPGAREVSSVTWIKVINVKNKVAVDSMAPNLDRGEAEAIMLAKEIDDLMILDDAKARRTAEMFGLNITGTIGILLLAANDGKIDFKSTLDLLVNTGFRLSKKEYHKIIELSENLKK